MFTYLINRSIYTSIYIYRNIGVPPPRATSLGVGLSVLASVAASAGSVPSPGSDISCGCFYKFGGPLKNLSGFFKRAWG